MQVWVIVEDPEDEQVKTRELDDVLDSKTDIDWSVVW